jgi:hypothetical protein
MTLQTKLGVVIRLDELRDLMRLFISEVEPDADLQVQLNWTFETFLQWLQRRQREQTQNRTGIPNHGVVRQFKR